jgi:chromosomal replication initiator protein
MSTSWSDIQKNLEKSLKSGIFQVWVKPLTGEIHDQTLILTAPNDFVASWVRERLQETIKRVSTDILGYVPEISVTAAKNEQASRRTMIPTIRQERNSLPLEYPRPSSARCNWRFSFDDFVVGDCNQLAYAACSSLCQEQIHSFNLFLCSGPGLGKTHLLQAIGHHLSSMQNQSYKQIAYISSEQFANQMIQAIKHKAIDEFKKRFRENVDLLLLEDIHFFQGKEKMQEELLSLIKTLEGNGSRVVFTSSFLPKELDKVDSQLTSYFCSGLLAPIHKPDYNLRLRLVRRKAAQFDLALPDSVGELVATTITSDVRQLESCIQNITLKSRLLHQEVSLDLARDVLKNYARETQATNMNTIIEHICRSFELPISKLRSKSRKKQVVTARNAAFYLARKHTSLSLKDIGQHFNRRHSTVLKGITSMEREITRDSVVGRQMLRMAEMFEQ